MNRSKIKKRLVPFAFTIILGFLSVSNLVVAASDTRQNFVVNNETKVLLDIDATVYYNGSIIITVTSGDPVNATVNGIEKEISMGESEELYILNTTSIYFSLSTYGFSEGYFDMELNYDLNVGGNNPVRRTIGIAAAFIIAISIISYYIRAKRLERKPDEEDEELADPETLRRRREAAGAEKKFWGLDDKE
ncbi:MAG: hypothetical protein E3J70_09620 [Candidatus Heimdallarchaeota archaeon]|nr:MAG: hypothetical protein E3J70_09620 [Candidatus Heimdallarchaeota archaeon]